MRPKIMVLMALLWAGCAFDRGGLGPPAGDRVVAEVMLVDGPRPELAGLDIRPADLGADLSCPTGASRPCYTGPAGTEGKGECKAGVERCSGGAWGPCLTQVLPQAESCDGKDNNCDDSIDEGVIEQCAYSGPAGTQSKGLCKAGTRTCSNGAFGACTGEVTPATEVCDHQDNDCDGSTDEGFTIKCESLACSGSGKIKTIGNLCVDNDGGSSGSSDDLEVYCCDGIARFCLSKETCPWRAGCTNPGAATCSHSGLSTDFMATVSCDEWNSHGNYYCTAAGQIYFTP